MSQPAIIAVIVALLVPLGILLRRDFIKGLAYAVFLCVSMPTGLRIEMPGSLPQLTIYRLALIIVFLFWLRHRDPARRFSAMPLFGVFAFWAAADFASLIFTTGSFVVSLKRYLDFVAEAAIFFFLLATSLRTREDALRILRAAWLGVTLVAALACVEKYTAFNPVDHLAPEVVQDADADQSYLSYRGDVTSTYQMRILLGTGMAMGWPLTLALLQSRTVRPSGRKWLWLSLLLLAAGCYFSQSRGPWLAAALSGVVLVLLAGAAIRRKLALLLVVALAVLVTRPGVLKTMVLGAEVTAETDSFKGGTFLYRLELWRVAWAQISGSPLSVLFGRGLGCGQGAPLVWKFSYLNGQERELDSWDNHLAYELYQSGVVGLAASLALFGSVLLTAWRHWRGADPADRPLAASLLASLLAYAFMLTNVMMFTKPVNFLFWSVAAVSCALALCPQEQLAVQEDDVPAGSLDALPRKAWAPGMSRQG